MPASTIRRAICSRTGGSESSIQANSAAITAGKAGSPTERRPANGPASSDEALAGGSARSRRGPQASPIPPRFAAPAFSPTRAPRAAGKGGEGRGHRHDVLRASRSPRSRSSFTPGCSRLEDKRSPHRGRRAARLAEKEDFRGRGAPRPPARGEPAAKSVLDLAPEIHAASVTKSDARFASSVELATEVNWIDQCPEGGGRRRCEAARPAAFPIGLPSSSGGCKSQQRPKRGAASATRQKALAVGPHVGHAHKSAQALERPESSRTINAGMRPACPLCTDFGRDVIALRI